MAAAVADAEAGRRRWRWRQRQEARPHSHNNITTNHNHQTRNNNTQKNPVVAVGHAVDLALLTVPDESFWAEPAPMRPLRLGDVPALQESVLVVGYPTGGDNTSVTSGVVSRVEVTQYVHAASHLMAIQVDAAINAGNSGGPALRASGGDVVVGVAFQNLPSADSIGYLIPVVRGGRGGGGEERERARAWL